MPVAVARRLFLATRPHTPRDRKLIYDIDAMLWHTGHRVYREPSIMTVREGKAVRVVWALIESVRGGHEVEVTDWD
jgi:hypothetical protein